MQIARSDGFAGGIKHKAVMGTKIGQWPVAEVAVKMSASPGYIGGRLDRGAPCYGEDNDYVYGELLGMSSQEIKALAEEGVI